MEKDIIFTNSNWLFHLFYRICYVYLSLKHPAVAESKAGACVTLCNQVLVMWPDFNEIGHFTVFYGITAVLA